MSNKVTTCVNCLGRGTVRVKRIIDKDFYYATEDCPICQGLGYADNERNKNGNKKCPISTRSDDWRCNIN